MKKLLIGLLTGAMVLGCVACGGNDTAKVEVADAQELLTKVCRRRKILCDGWTF